MDNFSKWEQASAELLKSAQNENKHSFLSQYGIDHLGVEGESLPIPSASSLREGHFQNIVPYQSEIFSEKNIQDKTLALFLKNKWPENFGEKDIFIYHQASPEMNSFKRAMLADQQVNKMNLGLDPYSLGLWKSTIYKFEVASEAFEVAKNREINFFRMTSQPYALAGASDSQQLAILLSSAVQLIDDLGGFLTPEQVLNQISFELSLKSHVFLGVAKIKSLNLLMARLNELYNCKGQVLAPVYITPSVRFLSAREPWNNILRMSAISSIAMWGGAAGVVSYPYDIFAKEASSSMHVSKNITEVLRLESHLNRVSNPVDGSYSLDQTIKGLLNKSWELFTEIQKKDGLRSVLRSGWLLDQIGVDAKDQERQFLQGKMKITGCNDFPLIEPLSKESPLPKNTDCHDVESWWINQYEEGTSESLCDVARYVPSALPALIEKWQFKADRLREMNPSFATIPVLIEDSLLKSKKFKFLQKTLASGGLKILKINPEELTDGGNPVTVVVAGDPEGEFASQCLESLERNHSSFKVWVGERLIEGFDENLNENVDLLQFFEKLFSKLEEQ